MSLLKYENVALQARVEEQSVHTEQLEYELTKVRKKHSQDINYAEQREVQDTKQITDLKGIVIAREALLILGRNVYDKLNFGSLKFESVSDSIKKPRLIFQFLLNFFSWCTVCLYRNPNLKESTVYFTCAPM